MLEIIKNNKNVKTAKIYNEFHSDFSCPRAIYNLKRKHKETNLLSCSVNRKKNPADQIQAVKMLASSGDKFIRSFCDFGSDDLPGFVLFYDFQLLDLFSLVLKGNFVIHVDKTFNLGIYYVTTLSFTNIKLINKESKKNPLFLGPVYIHKKSKNQNFEYFFKQLKIKLDEISVKLKCNSSYEHKLIFCTDQEQAIINGILKVFPYATILLCYIHLRKSIERSVDSSDLGKQISKLVYCKSLDSFNEKTVEILKTENFKNVTELHKIKYIHNELETIYKYILLPKWRLESDLPISNNLAESANSKIKSNIGKDGVTITPTLLVSEIRVLVENLYINVKKAFSGEGLFKLGNYETPAVKLDSDQEEHLFNHFISNCNDVAIPEVPKKKPKKSSFSKYVTYNNGRPCIQTSDKTESHYAWLFNNALKPNQRGKKKHLLHLNFKVKFFIYSS